MSINNSVETASYDDLQALEHLLGQLFAIEEDFSFDFGKVRQGLKGLMDDDRACVLVARHNKTVIGMCTAQLVISTAEGGYSAWIEDVVVDEGYRGRGVGRRLLDSISTWAQQRGATRLQLLADMENTSALGFYRNNGWQETQLRALRVKI